jgi:putative tricarboxylic transport membrane protein
MDLFANLWLGASVAFTPTNLFFCFLGTLIGTLIGVLPGIGPLATISMMLPSTYHLPPTTGIIMLAGVYFGSMYGGSTTSILVNLPGEAASVVTCLDGYQMARQGRAGAALGISAFGSFIAGTFGLVVLILISRPLAEFALRMGPPEYFSLLLMGVILMVYLAQGSMIKALIMATAGLFLGTVGTDTFTGQSRFAFGTLYLRNGIELVPVAMGLFGVAEVLTNLELTLSTEVVKTSLRNLLPSREDWKASAWPIVRGSLLGFFLGIFPGGGPVLSSFASYTLEKKLSKHPEQFGKGAIAGVAGPEAANNSCVSGAFIPLLTLGIPSTAVMAIMLSSFILHGLRPGPQLLSNNPDLFWGIIVSMYLGNVMLLVLNLPLIGLWVQVLRVPYRILFPLILTLCIIGAYSINNNILDVAVLIAFGVIGYLLRKFDFEAAPLVLAMVITPMIEDALRQSLAIVKGNFLGFFARPISAALLGFTALLIVSAVMSWIKDSRRRFSEDSL